MAVIAAIAVAQLAANLGYDSAAARYEDAATTTNGTKSQTEREAADLRVTTQAASQILSAQTRAIPVDPELEATLSEAVADAETAATRADAASAGDVPTMGDKPIWFWELFGATELWERRLTQVEKLDDDLRAAITDMTSADERVTQGGLSLVSAAGEAAPDFEEAHRSARNEAVIALRSAASDAVETTVLDDTAASAYLALQTAAAQVVSTEAEEMAEKSGPLKTQRLEIEAFARSLAPGVLLEFDWSPVVNGAGYDGSMGGYTTWWWDDPGRATIELSDSVAEQWPAERSRALVAHEVGHAISVKCEGMYDSSTQDSIEKWATAWAISMGFTDDANGVWAYGYPPQNYIDAAAGCR
ncbi:hypothetical protein [Microbacterium sp. Se5.02b]|uniref:hypothetical protein n=1 Tax=Microbacterium sp. Se5.02b TaxID=2864103 RepID=UPI001C68A43B|nr:hypothetical protein [Microbacterium sp. Se5.02b]QYM63027.1 hypothetical protein K1X59_11875 [Microbacterium sp. Se5.02b]